MSVSLNPYPVLQSGFVGASKVGLKLPDPIEPTLRQSVIFKEFKTPLLNYHYSEEVTELFNRWSANHSALKDFEFRERLLKAAFKAFGIPDFNRWLALQLGHGDLSALHQKFLLETLVYVTTGTPRRIENMQWINLLEAGPSTKAVRLTTEEFVRTRDGVHGGVKVPNTVKDMIVSWTQHRAGFEDLLVCLYVIFGQRSRQTDVTEMI